MQIDQALPLGSTTTLRIKAGPGHIQQPKSWERNAVPVSNPGPLYVHLFAGSQEIGDEGHVTYVPAQEIHVSGCEAVTALRDALNAALECAAAPALLSEVAQ